MIIFFLALQLGIVNVPFLDAMGDVGGVSTPASRRMAPDVYTLLTTQKYATSSLFAIVQ
jgi:hypothetical protein